MKKKIFLLAITFFIGLLGWQIIAKFQEEQHGKSSKRWGGGKGKGRAVTIEARPVETRDLEDVRFLSGTLQPYAEFTITSKLAGRLEYLSVDEGQIVRKWQHIGKIEDAALLQQVEQLRAELAVAEASQVEQEVKLNIAGRHLNRSQALHQKKILSDEELENSRSNFDTSQAQLHVSQAQINQRAAALKLARLKHQDTLIKAIWPGTPTRLTVSQRYVDPGATVSINTPIISLMDISRLKARLTLVEKDYGKIKVGQLANISTDAYPDLTFTGKVLRLAPRLNEQTHTAEVEMEIHNPALKLKPGMFIRAHLVLRTKAQTQTIPLTALVQNEGKPAGVFQVTQDQQSVVFIPITMGIKTRLSKK